MRNHLLISLIFICSAAQLFGQNVTILGPTSANYNQVKSYSLSFPGGTPNTSQADYGWTASSGNVVDDTGIGLTANVTWSSSGSQWVAFEMFTWDNIYYDIHQVTVSGGPPPPAPPAPTVSSTGCGTVTLQWSGSPTAPTTWFWQKKTSNGTSTTIGSGSTITFTNTTSGNYYIRARNSSGWGGQSYRYVSIPQNPSQPTAYNRTHCGSSTVSLSATPGHDEYRWYLNGSTTSYVSSTSSTYAVSTSNLTSYSVKVRDGSCWSVLSNSANVTGPDLSVLNIVGGSYCQGSGGRNLVVASEALDGFASFSPSTWFRIYRDGVYLTGFQASAAGTNADMSFGPYTAQGSNSNTYTLKVQKSGCSEVQLSQSATITENAQAVIAIDEPPYPQMICPGDDFTIDTNSSSAQLYSDSTGGSVLGSADSNGTITSSLGVGTYWVGLPSGTCVNTTREQVSIGEQPSVGTPNILFGDYVRCEGSGTTDFYVSAPFATNYSWSISPSTAGTIDANGIITWDNSFSGLVTVTATAHDICGRTSSSSQSVTVKAQPALASGSDKSRTGNGTLLLVATPGANGNTIRWYNTATGGSPLATHSTYVTPCLSIGTHNYYAASYNSNTGCEDTDRKLIRAIVNGQSQQTVADNYVKTWHFREPGINSDNIPNNVEQANLNIVYYDGLGRSKQSVEWQGSPDKIDLVQPVVYDRHGRRVIEYLPYAIGTDGSYKLDPVNEGSNYTGSEHHAFYQSLKNDSYAYAQTIYDTSPLNRVLKQGAPGTAWQPDPNPAVTTDKVLHYGYEVNTSADQVYVWDIDLLTDDLEATGQYSEGQLTKTVTTDEEGHAMIEFVDRLGRTVLKRVQAIENPNTTNYILGEWADTYYVYDGYGDLRYVLPPKVIEEMGSPTIPYAPGPTLLAQWAFQYQYDGRRRMIEKKVPGADWVYMVYDDRDRLVLTQDGEQRNANQWLFTKYDQLNRPISTGFYSSSESRSDIQERVNDFYAFSPDWTSQNGVSYVNGLFTKTTSANGWNNGGAASSTLIEAGQDGFLMAIATETTSLRMFGVTATSPNDHFNTIDYAIYLQNQNLYVYESGVSKGYFGKYETGDVFLIKRIGNTIHYERNGEIFYTSSIISSGDLIGDLSFSTVGGTLLIPTPVDMYESGGDTFDYTSKSFPYGTHGLDYLTFTYYDDYNFHHATLPDYQYQSTAENSTYFANVKGQVTGTMTKILDSDQWLRSVNYYDDRYRLIQSVNDNHKAGTERITSAYDFVGRVLKTETSHYTPEPILWRNQKNVQIKGGIFIGLQANASGMSSVNVLQENEDGWAETIITETSSNRFFGLNDYDGAIGHTEMDFYVYLLGDRLRVYHQGTYLAEPTTFKVGDRLRISRSGGNVSIYLNDENIYDFSQTSTEALVVDAALYTLGAELGYINCSFGIPQEADSPYPVIWTGLQYMTSAGSSLTKTLGGWNGKASSVNKLHGGQDGWLEFEAVATDKSLMMALSDIDVNGGYNFLDYAIYLRNNGQVNVYENGASKGNFGPYQTGDVFRIERVGETINYLQNGVILYTSGVTSTTDLIVDVAFNTTGGTVANIQTSFYVTHSEQNEVDITRTFDYDHAGRLINTWHESQVGVSLEENNNIEVVSGEIKLVDTQVVGTAHTGVVLAANEDGGITYRAEDMYNGKRIGFEFDGTALRYHMQFYKSHNIIAVRRGGPLHGSFNYAVGDELRIERKGTDMIFYKNGEVQSTINNSPTGALRVWVELNEPESVINGLKFGKEVLLAHNEYNELGELMEKNLHSEDQGSTFAQSTDYRYNIRGWLTSINNAQLTNTTDNNDTGQASDFWGMELGYNEALNGVTAIAAYNGNISGVKWSDNLGQAEQAYAYEYDPMNRLVSADHHTVGEANTSSFDVSIGTIVNPGYDLNGNITSLTRYGDSGAIDQLSYTYGDHGNQLQYVEDVITDTEGFIDGHSGTTANPDYEYDDNGNMIKDLNKDIVEITYNHLNLPRTVEKADGQMIQYRYDAAGIKLSQQVYETEIVERASTLSTAWGNSYVNRAFITGPIGGENDMLRVYATSHNNVHRLYQNFSEIKAKPVHVKARIYLPSGNTNVNGIQLAVGNYIQSQIYTTTDQWIDVEYLLDEENTNNGSVFFHLLSNGATHYAGANSNTDDVFYIKDIEVSTITPMKTTDYVGEFIYENDTLQLIQHEEGRVVPALDAGPRNWIYQYFLRDHLGNTRVVFTTDPKTIEFGLNYESNAADPDDEALFDNLQNVITADVHDRVDAGNESFNHNQVQLLNGATNGAVGSVLTIPVGAGDKISAEVYAKYLAPTGTNNPTAAIGNLVIGAITGTTGTGIYEGAITSGYGAGGTVTSLINANASSTEPMAFINLLFLPDDATGSIASSHFAFKQITSASSNSQAILELDQPYEAPEAGYVVVYLSNESAQLTEVYFDDLKVTVDEHPVVQTDSYYPFGMQMAGGYQRITAKENRYLYNGKERITDLGLNWDDFGARMYMPDIGRWGVVDAMSEKAKNLTPYRYGLNNPVRFIDPDGNLELDPSSKGFKKLRRFVKRSIRRAARNKKINAGLKKHGRFSNEQLKEALTFGKGPKVKVTDLKGTGRLGRFKKGGQTLEIDESLVNRFEKAIGKKGDALEIVVGVVLLHELVHYGEYYNNGDENAAEEGDEFEEDVFGQKVRSGGKAKRIIEDDPNNPANALIMTEEERNDSEGEATETQKNNKEENEND